MPLPPMDSGPPWDTRRQARRSRCGARTGSRRPSPSGNGHCPRFDALRVRSSDRKLAEGEATIGVDELAIDPPPVVRFCASLRTQFALVAEATATPGSNGPGSIRSTGDAADRRTDQV